MTASPRHRFAVRLPLVLPGQRIGLLGGSFNPAHEAHRLISTIALKRLGLDQVWWIVSPGNPLKTHGNLSPLSERMAAARRVANHNSIRITSFEAALGSPFTADTLSFLKERYRGIRFVWLMGADNLVQMPRWRRWRQIFETMPVAVVNRPGWHFKAHASRAAAAFARYRIAESKAEMIFNARAPRWVLLTGPLSAQSSTAIRARGKTIKDRVVYD